MSPEQEAMREARAAELWKHLAGLFGADALKRKFGPVAPPEWVSILGKLDRRELERGMRRIVHSGRDQLPSLPAFVRLCKAVGDDSIDEGERPPALPNPDRWQGDPWDAAANRHLLAYLQRAILQRLAQRISAVRYDETTLAPLLKAKRAWAADMRDLAQHGGVDPKLQRACWEDYIKVAEREIAALLAGAAKAAAA